MKPVRKYLLRHCAGVMVAGALGLTGPAVAQNVPVPTAVPTDDRFRHGASSPSAGPCEAAQQRGPVAPPGTVCPTRRERKLARQRYRAQHRRKFPGVYQPGIE